jgi:hypothetical protein
VERAAPRGLLTEYFADSRAIATCAHFRTSGN